MSPFRETRDEDNDFSLYMQERRARLVVLDRIAAAVAVRPLKLEGYTVTRRSSTRSSALGPTDSVRNSSV